MIETNPKSALNHAQMCHCEVGWGAKKWEKGGNWDVQARINLTYQLHGMPKPSIRLTSLCTAPYYTLLETAGGTTV